MNLSFIVNYESQSHENVSIVGTLHGLPDRIPINSGIENACVIKRIIRAISILNAELNLRRAMRQSDPIQYIVSYVIRQKDINNKKWTTKTKTKYVKSAKKILL